MKRTNKNIILLISYLLTACTGKTDKIFYDTGQLKIERMYKRDTSLYTETIYYFNGFVKSKGQVFNRKRVGLWKEWYSDGSEKWIGEYDNGERKVTIIPSQKPSIIIEGPNLKRGIPVNLKVRVQGIHPEDLAVGCNNGVISISKEIENYDYELIPEKEGFVKLYFFIKNSSKMVQIGVDSLSVSK